MKNETTFRTGGQAPATALGTYIRQWHGSFMSALAHAKSSGDFGTGRFHDFVWEQGILEHLSPAQPEAREAGTRACVLWEDRDDFKLHWRILYASQAELMTEAGTGLPDTGCDGWKTHRAIRHVLSTAVAAMEAGPQDGQAAQALRISLLEAFTERSRQELLKLGATAEETSVFRLQDQASVAGTKAFVEGYAFNGRIIVGRETIPTAPHWHLDAWELSVKDGRWHCHVWPWQLSRS